MAGTEAEEAAWEMATAETLRARGELAEAANWYRRAANHLMEAGEDERAISVAKLAAELAALDDAGRSRSDKSMNPAARASAAPQGNVSSAAPTLSPAPQAKPSAAPKPPPPPPAAAASGPVATNRNNVSAPAGPNQRQKLPWQRSSRPPPPKPATRPSMAPRPSAAPKPASTTLAPNANGAAPAKPAPLAATGPVRPGLVSRPSPPLGDKLQAPPVSPPKPLQHAPPPSPPRAAKPSATLPIDDAVTNQLDLGAIEMTSLDATAALRKHVEDDLTTESPLAALVDEAVSKLGKQRANATSESTDEVTAQRSPAISPERAAEFDAIAARLPALPLFAEFDADEIRRVAREAGVSRFQAGDNLTEAGAPEGPMYVLVEGEARIAVAGDESRTHSLGAGDFVGEMSALFGGPRVATVTASGHVEAVAFAPSMVRWMVGAFPSFGEVVREAILDRLRSSLPHMAPMFRLLDAPQRKEAFAPFEFATLEAGDALVREGEIADALYVVAAGEVELYGGHGGTARPVRGRSGEVVGLASIHGEEPATATVRAARRTLVAMISRTKYPAWIQKHAKLAQAVGDVGTLGRGVLC